ncbi:aminotransferase class V-fold PLP-dependent enzyme [Pseudobacteriovorax antillogorgiicola]|uniref:Cysteine desulfurase n=1 Tax=Pseudobacteriovorax antillogorgiicola TaxID=1513793 RepID=A0A1Y6BGJ0_9BACT|nr:cysteine desulfurase [Pseudobacteriovorax antillogorgiicola]TCS56351.1 cysteine desulfurase/selenocysteine lyase [Pseudobacteriovorax antillogorgiicola]SMF06748.1 cysteine desulfurase / selenocysteine lyase [Pseudobacteriovorax antillogorgiicola]
MVSASIASIREQFPIITQSKPALAYLDSAASSQKPKCVIDRIKSYYESENANVHRGIYKLSETATAAFEASRKTVAEFLGGVKEQEVIFTKGTTDSVNLVASSWCGKNLKEGDEIVLTVAEHHSNMVPWQIAAEKAGATIKYIPLTSDYRLDLDVAASLISGKTKLVAMGHVSNVLGIIHPVKSVIALAKKVGAVTFIDGAQGAPHLTLDMKDLDCDFYAFSGHKVMAPTGTGVLYGRENLLNDMPPYQGGGDMIETVSLKGSTWNTLPSKFEAGTPNIAGFVGLGEALRFVMAIDKEAALEHDRRLGARAIEVLSEAKGVRLFSKVADDWVGVVTFYHEQIHPHDLASICDSEQVCIRAGHHCAQPLMEALGVSATSRMSPYVYNNDDDVDAFIKAFRKAEKLFC